MIFHANGKLLISGEYVVLSGANALAVPTQAGQSLEVFPSSERSKDSGRLMWKSKLLDGSDWFIASFEIDNWRVVHTSDVQVSAHLRSILQAITLRNPAFAEKAEGKLVTTKLEFPRDWGLGSSSTLLHLLGQWGNADPFYLMDQSFGGSGYDLKAAAASGPFRFWRNPKPKSESVELNWPFLDELYFVHLGRKQNSREGIQRYRQKEDAITNEINRISSLTEAFIKAADLQTFEEIIEEHEQIIAGLLELPRAKALHFPKHPGQVKSLGAWGGDFVMLTSGGLSAKALKEKLAASGFKTVIPFREMVLM
ncbi:MAG: GHMP kinase [Bacteroidetes bacterium]|nr:GHMP kinase [Bacteroidota bacterium]